MNPAQKRTWWTFVISLITLMIAGAVITLRLNGTIDYNNHIVNRIISICATIPLILIVLLSKVYPGKLFDERDNLIETKATIWGIMGMFGFMALGGWLILIQDLEGTVKSKYLLGFVYLAAMVWLFLSATAGLVYYYLLNPFKNHELQGESK